MNTDFQVRYRCPHLQEFDPDPNIPVFLFYMNDVDPYAERCADRLPWLKHDVQLDRSLSPLFRMQLEEYLFTACGQTAVLYHAELAAALALLPEQRQEEIFLYYFLRQP